MSEPIRLGLMVPMTGPTGIYGQEVATAAHIACAEINRSGGILGRSLQIVVEDDSGMPDAALKAAMRLLDQHRCVGLIGNLLSNSLIAVATQIAEPRQVPLLNFSSYEGSISSQYFFNFSALPNQQYDKVIPFVARRFGLKMYFAGSNYEWPRSSIDSARRSLLALDGDVVGETYLPLGASSEEINRLLAEVARSGADVFVPHFVGQDQLTLLTEFATAGLKQRMAVVTGHLDEVLASQLAPEVRAGLYSSSTYFMTLETAGNREYLQQLAAHTSTTGIWPDGNGFLTNFGEGAYICVKAFSEAVQIAGCVVPEALVGALEHVRFPAPQGIVEMDAATHHAKVNSVLACCGADGRFMAVSHFGPVSPQIPVDYLLRPHFTSQHETSPSPALAASIAEKIAGAQLRVDTAQHILSIADMAVIATDSEGLITEANRRASALFGYHEDELLGLSVHKLVQPHRRQRHAEMLSAFVEGAEPDRRMSGRNQVFGHRKDGSFFPLEASIAKFHDGRRWLLVVTLRDITERKRAEEELTRRATHDALTGLPNRALIRERLSHALQRSRRSGESIALLFLDLDGFKLINDTHGHGAGDELLKAIANRMLEQVRPGDTVARLAGDEFVVLCEKVEKPASMSVLAQRIIDVIRQPIDFQGSNLFVTGSIGVAVGDGNTHAADDMLRYADTAMYTAKERGRDGWQFFNETLQEEAHQRIAIINGLRTAIERHELSALFQPIVKAETGRIVGAELLLRWHPSSGPVSPAIFIPVAETTAAIVPIGLWVFREACRAEAEWRQLWGEEASPYISVNVSARQLNETVLIEEFSAILAETGAYPERLMLEITETSLMADVEGNVRTLRRLADLGLRVAVDDFGTGYSSLAQLTRLPVNVLKIDKAFVEGIEKSEDSRTVIRAVMGIGRSLGLKLVAEGVETPGQRLELCTYGCDLIQGYLFHRPLSKSTFAEVFERELRQQSKGSDAALHFLIYVSRSKRDMSEEALVSLLRQFQNVNRRNGISGCLVHKDGEFMQLLEGNKEAVLRLCDQIRSDDRHGEFRVVAEGPMQRRTFTDWGMTLLNLNHDDRQMSADLDVLKKRKLSFSELADDPQLCFTIMVGLAAKDR